MRFGLLADTTAVMGVGVVPVPAIHKARPTLRAAREPDAQLSGIVFIVFDRIDRGKQRRQNRVRERPAGLVLEIHYIYIRRVVRGARG